MLILLMIGLILPLGNLYAQDDDGKGDEVGTIVEYGEIAEGNGDTMTVRFLGNGGDVVVISLGPTDFESSFSTETLAVSFEDDVLIEKEGITDSVIALQLPSTGEYKVVGQGSVGGAWQMEIINPDVLEASGSVSGTVSNEDTAYYAILTEDEFTLAYTLDRAGFVPELAVNIDSDFNLDPIGMLSGSQLVSGTMTINPVNQTLFILTVQRATLDFVFGDVTADYTISMSQ